MQPDTWATAFRLSASPTFRHSGLTGFPPVLAAGELHLLPEPTKIRGSSIRVQAAEDEMRVQGKPRDIEPPGNRPPPS